MTDVPIMRSVHGCFEMVHKADHDSPVSEHMIRQSVMTGRVKSVRAGRRILVNYGSLLDYLTNPTPEANEPEVGTIRPIRA